MNNLPYRPNVCLIILNNANQVFIGERHKAPDCWQLPQGGAEPEFTLAENALREASEELGVDLEYFEVIKQLTATHVYDFRVIPPFARDLWKGQSQTFWLLRFTGEDRLIDLNRFHPEFQAWKWCAATELLELTEKIRAEGYSKALPELISYLNE